MFYLGSHAPSPLQILSVTRVSLIQCGRVSAHITRTERAPGGSDYRSWRLAAAKANGDSEIKNSGYSPARPPEGHPRAQAALGALLAGVPKSSPLLSPLHVTQPHPSCLLLPLLSMFLSLYSPKQSLMAQFIFSPRPSITGHRSHHRPMGWLPGIHSQLRLFGEARFTWSKTPTAQHRSVVRTVLLR